MSDDNDKDGKTEDPTEKRISDAREKGQVPNSRELGVALSVIAIAISISVFIPGLVARLTQGVALFLGDPAGFPLENSADASRVFWLAVAPPAIAFLMVAGVIATAGILASVVQNEPKIVLSRIAPDLSRISPMKGLGRIFGWQGLFELLKGAAKIGIAAGAAYITVSGSLSTFAASVQYDAEAIPQTLGSMLLKLTIYTAVAVCAIAVLDILWSRRTWMADLRMSRQDIKQEAKDSEGDQTLKAKARRIARSRLQSRMMTNMPRATLVVVNPTHYAIALRYVRQEGGAPKVVAKGKDLIALRIKDIAEQNGIPIYEDKRLARSLYRSVEVDQFIPAEFYKAVAEIVIYLTRRSRPIPRLPSQ